MGRRLRSHLPGVPFHITARAQGRAPIFTGLEAAAVSRIRACAWYSDVRLLAYAVMPNHFHLVVVQGARPLARLMHPVMRQLALLVMTNKGVEGHVFERRYSAAACLDAEHLRNAIAYVHLNGQRAGICSSADDFPWCSHQLIRVVAAQESNGTPEELGMETSLRIFGSRPDDDLEACLRHYEEFLCWRLALDKYMAAGGSAFDREAPGRPDCGAGDAYWVEEFGSCAPSRAEASRVRCLRDLRDLALQSIRQTAPEMELDWLRSGDRGRKVVRVRRHLITRALLAGHSPNIVADFLNVSRTTVSAAGGQRRKKR